MQPWLLIQAGNPPAPIREQYGSFADMFKPLFVDAGQGVMVVRAYADQPLPALTDLGAALITGSPGNVTDNAPWMRALVHWIRGAMARRLPLMGVCFGHQIMAHALGGRVDYHPAGREVGSQFIELTAEGRQDPWLQHLPASFPAQLLHEQSVLEAPAMATVLGRNAHDAHQILRYAEHAVSVQFHPEFDAAIMRAYLDVMADPLTQEGFAVESLKARVQVSTASAALVPRFFGQSFPAK